MITRSLYRDGQLLRIKQQPVTALARMMASQYIL
jgi:hypothetical protein